MALQAGAAGGIRQQQIITLPGGQQIATAAAAPQVLQIPQFQQMVQVQVPVSTANGQTVYQTMQMPMAAAAPAAPQVTTQLVPQVVQTSSGQQQIVMQQVAVQQPQPAQFQQPQFAQVLMPGGQIQQVQVLGMPGQAGQVMAAGGMQFATPASFPVQIQQQAAPAIGIAASSAAAQVRIMNLKLNYAVLSVTLLYFKVTTTVASLSTNTTTTASTSTTASATASSSTTGNAAAGLLQPKQEPIDPSDEPTASGETATGNTSSANAAAAISNLSTMSPLPQQAQQQQQVVMTANGQQVIIQQPQQQQQQPATPVMQQAQVLSVRTPSGQVVVPGQQQSQAQTASTATSSAASTPAAAATVTPANTVAGVVPSATAGGFASGGTINIPGLGNVQVVQQLPVAAAAAQAPAQILSPGGTQIQMATAATAAAPLATQQALQQDPNDPTKWHVVQVATAAAPMTAAAPAHAVTALPAGSASTSMPMNFRC